MVSYVTYESSQNQNIDAAEKTLVMTSAFFGGFISSTIDKRLLTDFTRVHDTTKNMFSI